MDNLQTGGIVVGLITVLKGKDFWNWVKQFTRSKLKNRLTLNLKGYINQ